MAGWLDITQPGFEPTLESIGYTATRWPGGSESDQYQWTNGSSCGGGKIDANSTFDNFINDIARPAKLDVAVTLNYGSNERCNGGGDPAEAAAWVAHAKANGETVRYWTVGNEVFGSWEYDLHSKPHDPVTYANAVAKEYYPQIKAADSNAQVGVVLEGTEGNSWDPIVLSNAKYDFVEIHYYAQAYWQVSDKNLLQFGASNLTRLINRTKEELASAGRPSTPIYVGELGSVGSHPGKQTTSITQALFAGMALGELMNDGISRSTWWLAYGGCSDSASGANFSTSLYGWQNFGGYMTISDGTPEYGCPNATPVPRGTPLPTARAYQLMSGVIRDGEHSLSTTVATTEPNVRAYAVTKGLGFAVVLFNLDQNNPHAVNIQIDHVALGTSATLSTYGKAQYDDSRNNVWTGPVTRRLGSWSSPVSVLLPAWSMSVLELAP